jgi:hypothetical protein
MAESQTVEITSTFSQPGSPPETSRMLYDYQHHLGESFFPESPEGAGQPDVILDGSTMYDRLPNLTSGLLGAVKAPTTKPWVVQTITAEESESPMANLLDPLTPAGDMATLLNRLAPVVQSVHQVGTVLLGGVETTRYDVTISDRALNIKPAGPLELWVDSEHRVRQLQFSFSNPQLPVVTLTAVYSNFGLPVHVTIPPASEVETFQQWFKDYCDEVNASNSSGGVVMLSGGSSTSRQCPTK